MTALFAIWLLISGLDDLFLDLAWLYRWLLELCLVAPTASDLASVPHKRFAIFVPLWREHAVIARMIEHNLSAPGDFFLGVYPNDAETLAAARELEHRYEGVHVSVCPHAGPTSKADNLNWIYRGMRRFEGETGVRFDVVVTHDAEDLMHAQELTWINYYTERYDMVQIPVLPFPTPSGELLHGVYCDEFAEYQSKELVARRFLGGFLPSCGVGAGYTRAALERLAEAHGGPVFESRCLTEDYESGFRLHWLGCAQIFVPVERQVATRSYFPRDFRSAVKQRTRWVMGISLQSWELHGWGETCGQLYWFWRDRKGLVGAIVGPAAYLVCLFGLAEWKPFLGAGAWWIVDAFAFSMGLQVVHLSMRMGFTARIYGWRFASAAPLRVVIGNAINFCAAVCAIRRYAARQFTWLKTEHAYPTGAALTPWRTSEALAGQPDIRLRRSAASAGVRNRASIRSLPPIP